jgi:hypothetical protein
MVLRGFFIACILGLTGCEAANSALETFNQLQTATNPPQLNIPAERITLPSEGHFEGQITDSGSLDGISVCSFNIQFLGNSRSRDNRALAELVAPYDIVVVQELVSPPYIGTFPDGTPFKPDSESAEFFDAMRQHGFEFVLSEEDTGTGDTIHKNGSSTEWWVAFYKPSHVAVANDLPQGYLALDRSNHDHFERVPYAFGFRTLDSKLDFVLISVPLPPGSGSKDRTRRAEELATIAHWIDLNDHIEHDFIILGDMNIEDARELAMVTPAGFQSLNDECRPTNTNVNGPRPYDHVMFNSNWTNEIDGTYDMQVVNLLDELKDDWHSSKPYPGAPYDHNAFRAVYSDHHPVVFRLSIPTRDDDVAEFASGPRPNAR